MATTAQQKAEKWKNKKWFNVYAPQVLGGNVIGEVPASDETAMLGRVIKVSLSWVTQDPSHSFMTIGLRVVNAKGNAAETSIDYIESTFSYIHSLVRRFSSAIYTVDKVKDKDGKETVVKLLAVTRNRVTTPKKKAIRKEISKYVNDAIASKNKDEIVKMLIEKKFQEDGIARISKIAPISKFELKRIEFSKA